MPSLMEQGYGTSYGIKMEVTAREKKEVDRTKNHRLPFNLAPKQ